MAEGLDRHNALHAVGSVLAERIFEIVRADRPDGDDGASHNWRLDKLTAKKWRRQSR